MFSSAPYSASSLTRTLLAIRLISLPPVVRVFSRDAHVHSISKIAADLQSENERHQRQDAEQTQSGGVVATGFQKPMASKEKKPAEPRPSASVLLVSPTNQILLLQRVQQSRSFASAHVFPGGNVSAFHDGEVDGASGTAALHEDCSAYRQAAIRETFEESGILLARNAGFGRLIEVDADARDEGRRRVHADEVRFDAWLARHGGRADLDGLVPFTRWITPADVPRRFTTQMYLYFLPTAASAASAVTVPEGDEAAAAAAATAEETEVEIPAPTTDGGKEHTTARFLPASTWCRLAQEGRIILFPPQFFLLHTLAQFLDNLPAPDDYGSVSRVDVGRSVLERRRKELLRFVRSGSPPWTDKCISPTRQPQREGRQRQDGRRVLGLHSPGPELEALHAGRAGLTEQCVLVDFRKEGPRRLAVISRDEAIHAGAKI